ncbi:hypothetical protein [Microbacterium sp. 11MF]|uniref:hypothetical protein n=1 Tax=Microbacterium sp. 11MF TaxID=1169146 RepID=UPI000362FD2E|nr:hypothetical protein [Microbacterium sp. 11MF]
MSDVRNPFIEASLRIGSHELPTMLFDWVFSGRLREKQHLAEAVPYAWSSAHLPFAALGYRKWVEFFEMAGYTEDGLSAKRPSEPITLYRAAEPRYVHRLAWTASLNVAERFLEINEARYGAKPRNVYTITVAPDRLLAHITDRNEDEYIVDSRGLRARRVAEGGH